MSLSAAERKRREDIVINQCGGIHPPFEAFYLHSIHYAASQSSLSFSMFENAAREEMEPQHVFSAIQEALSHAASLSRFFWPSRMKDNLAQARGVKLREAFNLTDESSLKSRDLRNAFEHYDEKLDLYLLNDPVGCFFPGPIVDSHELADEEISNIFKLVDPEAGICVMLGKKFEFRAIQSEVFAVCEKSESMQNNGSRL